MIQLKKREEFMSEETTDYVTGNGPSPRYSPSDARLLARKPGRELFPAAWLRHNARITYTDGEDVSGYLLDFCSIGLLVQMNDGKALIAWDSLRSVELQES
jgi:hypothetical protein